MICIYFTHMPLSNFQNHFRSSPLEVLLWEDVLKIYIRFTGEYPCWNVISIKLQFFGIIFRHGYSVNLLHIFRTPLVGCFFHFPFSPLSDSRLSKIRVQVWVEEPYIGELHVITAKFRNKLPSFHYWRIAMAQNYDRETNLIQRAYILTWFSVWSIHDE